MPKFHLQEFTFVKSHKNQNPRTIKQTDSVDYKALLPKHKMQIVIKHQWERSWGSTSLARAATTDFTLQACIRLNSHKLPFPLDFVSLTNSSNFLFDQLQLHVLDFYSH